MAEISIGYVLSTLVIVSLTALMVSFVSVYKGSLNERYENSAMKAVTNNVAHALITVYINGQRSGYTPFISGKATLAKTIVGLPEQINSKPYEIKINNSEKLVCSYILGKEVCSPIIGIPSIFNITSNITSSTLDIIYWRENNNTILNYIIID